MRKDPRGNILPARLHYKHGAYWYVYRNRWERLSDSYNDALTAWSMRVNPASGMAGLVDRVLVSLDKRGKLSDSTMKQYQQAAIAIKTAFADFAPNQVRQTDVAKFHDFHIDKPNMANRYLTVLRIVFDFAIRWGEADSNPAIGVKRHEERKRDRYLTDSELAAIRTAASPWMRLCIDVLYLTAQRIDDVLNITLADISDDGIKFQQEKTGARVLVKMSPELRDVVDQARKLRGDMLSPYLFHPRGKRGPYAYKAAYDAYKRAAKKAGVTDTTVHDLRAKSLTDADAEGKDAQRLAGHASPAMTRRYLRLRQTVIVDGPNLRQFLDT